MLITEYWRSHQNWSKYLGKRGQVIASSHMEVAASDQVSLTPYSYVLVDIDGERLSLMGGVGEDFAIGDQVMVVLRKIKKEAPSEVLTYGLKVTKKGANG